MQVTDEYLNRYSHIANEKRRVYAAMVSAMDDGVGALLDQLETSGQLVNTIIFFLSDNGGVEQLGANNGILNKGKGSLYEGGIRVPFAMRWGSKIPAGQVFDSPIISLDIFGTIAAVTAVETKNPLDGKNLMPFITGDSKSDPHPQLFWRKYDHNSFAIRNLNDKLLQENQDQLYFNLSNDIGEENPMDSLSKINQLQMWYDEWNAQNRPPAFLGLLEDKEYSAEHPDRYVDVEKY
jgi:arylsulfatase A-like enzyme